MIAEYDKWYECVDGQMPEDFENCIDTDEPRYTYTVLLSFGDVHPTLMETDFRMKRGNGYVWRNAHNYTGVIAWKLPRPYRR